MLLKIISSSIQLYSRTNTNPNTENRALIWVWLHIWNANFLYDLSISGENTLLKFEKKKQKKRCNSAGKLLAPLTASITTSLSAFEKGGKSLSSYPEYQI